MYVSFGERVDDVTFRLSLRHLFCPLSKKNLLSITSVCNALGDICTVRLILTLTNILNSIMQIFYSILYFLFCILFYLARQFPIMSSGIQFYYITFSILSILSCKIRNFVRIFLHKIVNFNL